MELVNDLFTLNSSHFYTSTSEINDVAKIFTHKTKIQEKTEIKSLLVSVNYHISS